MRFSKTALFSLVVSSAAWVHAVDSDVAPRPVPLTRPEMKEYLEDMKGRKLRIPLPELTEADKEKLGERATSYESRLRYHYASLDVQGRAHKGPADKGKAKAVALEGVALEGVALEGVALAATTIPTIRATMLSRCSCSGSCRGPTTVSTAWAIKNRSCSARG